MISVFTNRKQLMSLIITVAISVFMVTLMVQAVTYVDTDSVGIATATPGAAFGVKGAGILEGFVSASYFTATSSNPSWFQANFGIGTTAPTFAFGVNGSALIEDTLYVSALKSTSTTDLISAGALDVRENATSTFVGGFNIASSTVMINDVSGRMAIGTSTFADADVPNTLAVDPVLSLSGAGSANLATGTLYVAGGGSNGGQIILKSTDGIKCASITVTIDTTALDDAVTLTSKVVACPK